MNEFENYKFFAHRTCEFFPCHKGADPAHFNCLFCYCPLYALGGDCGGAYRFTPDGIKDCSGCMMPHIPDSYEIITGRFRDIQKLVVRQG